MNALVESTVTGSISSTVSTSIRVRIAERVSAEKNDPNRMYPRYVLNDELSRVIGLGGQVPNARYSTARDAAKNSVTAHHGCDGAANDTVPSARSERVSMTTRTGVMKSSLARSIPIV